MIDASQMLIALLVGHFLLDLLRSDSIWAPHSGPGISPRELLWALAHGLVAAGITLLFLAEPWNSLIAGSLVASGHCLISLFTSRFQERKAFAIGEPARLVILLGIWWVFIGAALIGPQLQDIDLFRGLVVLLAYTLVLKPASSIIRLTLKPWVQQMASVGDNSLVKAGAMIGYLERSLILSFLLMGEYVAIGFVLALKAAYRFHETEETAKAEYMLMGTFLSFALTLVVGVVARLGLT